jgi:hypothetical protein
VPPLPAQEKVAVEEEAEKGKAVVMKTQPLKGSGGSSRAIASFYISVVLFVTYVCISGRLDARIALRS